MENKLERLEGEIWKEHNIGIYVSNLGRCFIPQNGANKEHYTYGSKRKDKYLQIKFNKKPYLVHRLVAECFLSNHDNLPIINHKDENPSNNNVSNLEWCTQKYNLEYGTRLKKAIENTNYKLIAKKISKPINQYSLSGEFIKTWNSMKEL